MKSKNSSPYEKNLRDILELWLYRKVIRWESEML